MDAKAEYLKMEKKVVSIVVVGEYDTTAVADASRFQAMWTRARAR